MRKARLEANRLQDQRESAAGGGLSLLWGSPRWRVVHTLSDLYLSRATLEQFNPHQDVADIEDSINPIGPFHYCHPVLRREELIEADFGQLRERLQPIGIQVVQGEQTVVLAGKKVARRDNDRRDEKPLGDPLHQGRLSHSPRTDHRDDHPVGKLGGKTDSDLLHLGRAVGDDCLVHLRT